MVTQLRSERQRLVQQQHLGPVGPAPASATRGAGRGELLGLRRRVRQVHRAQRIQRALGRWAWEPLTRRRTPRFCRTVMCGQRVVLEDGVHVPSKRRHRLTSRHPADVRRGQLEAAITAAPCLAGAGRPAWRRIAGRDVQVHPVHRAHRAEMLVQPRSWIAGWARRRRAWVPRGAWWAPVGHVIREDCCGGDTAGELNI